MEIKNFYDSLQVLEPRNREWTRKERLSAMERPLLAWYDSHARVLPWRENPTPYRVWISEIMLQQTRVEAVKPYFERFVEELPDVLSLAQVEDDRLMKLWEGLGYYTRARNLKKAAGQIVERHGGQLPADPKALLALAGIGSYTAGAIASIAFGIPIPAVDGNVLRVLTRVLADRADITKQQVKRQFEEELEAIMPLRAGDFNQALMEIGAMVCIPNGKAKCEACPLASVCLARKQGIAEELPVKTKKKARRVEELTMLLIENDSQISLHRRADKGLLAGLWELPNLEGHLSREEVRSYLTGLDGVGKVQDLEDLGAAKHIFTHVEWHMIGYRILVSGPLPDTFFPVDRKQLADSYALPSAFRAYTDQISRE